MATDRPDGLDSGFTRQRQPYRWRRRALSGVYAAIGTALAPILFDHGNLAEAAEFGGVAVGVWSLLIGANLFLRRARPQTPSTSGTVVSSLMVEPRRTDGVVDR